MSIGGISSSSYTSQTSSTDTSGPGNDPIGQLLKAIKSGNLTAAKAAYQNVLDHAPGQNSSASSSSTSSSGSSTSSSGDPLQDLLTQLGTALQSGDLSTAQSLVTTFEANKPQGGAGSAPPPPPPDGTGGDQALGSAVGSLLSSVQSGDLSSAQSAYATVSSLLGTDSTSSSASSSTASSSSSSSNPLLTLISSLGTSLSNDDLSGAQSTLSAFAENAESGLTYNNYA